MSLLQIREILLGIGAQLLRPSSATLRVVLFEVGAETNAVGSIDSLGLEYSSLLCGALLLGGLRRWSWFSLFPGSRIQIYSS